MAGFKLLHRSAFTTDAGLKGVKLILQSKPQAQMLRQVQYLLPGEGTRKYVVTFSALAAEGGKYDALVEGAAKTFSVR